MKPAIQSSHPFVLWVNTFTQLLPAIAVLATCNLMIAMNDADADLWGHVLYGQEILDEGTLPRTATWTFTAEGYRWINHENIAEIVMAAAVNLFGPQGLTVGKYLFGWAMLGVIWWRARVNGASIVLTALVCLCVAFSIEFHWHFRPQIFGYVYFAVMAAILHWCFITPDNRPAPLRRLIHLCWLIPLAALWANTHGSFAAGVCIGIAYLGLRWLQLLWTLRQQSTIDTSSVQAAVALPIIAAGICLATLANPYGVQLHLWLWEALHVPRPEISDWEMLPLFSFSRETIGFWVMAVSTVGVILKSKDRDWVHVVMLSLIAWQAVSHIRHLPLLAIAWASWLTPELGRIWQTWMESIREQTERLVTGSPVEGLRWQLAPIAWCGYLMLIGALTWPHLERLNVDKNRYPVDALHFMARNRLEGHTVVTFNWAQYAISFFAHEQMDSAVAIDGRFRTCYPQEVLDVYFDFLFGENYAGQRFRSPNSGPIDATRALTYHDPDLFLISRRQRSTVRTLQAHADEWTLLYQDGLAQVWGRRDHYSNPQHERFFPESLRTVKQMRPVGHAQWPAFFTGDSTAQPPRFVEYR